MNYKSAIKKIYFVLVIAMLFVPPVVSAATPNLNPFDPNFKLSICDGPRYPSPLPAGMTPPPADYKPCDFKGLMDQIQFLINAMIMLGMLAAIVGFSYAGFLYISGEQAKITHAHEIFRMTVVGLIMMLTAWFIVFQLLTWLANDSTGAKTLLGV